MPIFQISTMSNTPDDNSSQPSYESSRNTSLSNISQTSNSENIDNLPNTSRSMNDDVNMSSNYLRSDISTNNDQNSTSNSNFAESSNPNSNHNDRFVHRNHTASNNTTSSNSSNYNYADNANVNNSNNNNNNNNRNTINNVPLLGVRDRLFHAMFFKASVTYARSVPSSIRRVIEFLILLKVSIIRKMHVLELQRRIMYILILGGNCVFHFDICAYYFHPQANRVLKSFRRNMA